MKSNFSFWQLFSMLVIALVLIGSLLFLPIIIEFDYFAKKNSMLAFISTETKRQQAESDIWVEEYQRGIAETLDNSWYLSHQLCFSYVTLDNPDIYSVPFETFFASASVEDLMLLRARCQPSETVRRN